MKRIYWDSFEYNGKRSYFTVDDFGLTFVSDPGKGVSQIFNFYPKEKFEFCYQEQRTVKYRKEITEYLAGERTDFDVLIDVKSAGTLAQQYIWRAVTNVKYGETESITKLMRDVKIGNKQAVLEALHQSPVIILIPLHRIINSDDSYQIRGGKQLQKQLLELEALNGIDDTRN